MSKLFQILKSCFYYLTTFSILKIRLGSIGLQSKLLKTKINGHKNILIGTKVYINDYGWLVAEQIDRTKKCILEIGDGTYIGRFSHIYATSKISIGKKVLMADKVYIADNLHHYKNIDIPIIEQQVLQTNEVVISDGAWLGENVCVIGASVGLNSVVGANSVVTKSIPDYCVAVGTPAKIIKRYNLQKKEWQKTDEFGNFINT